MISLTFGLNITAELSDVLIEYKLIKYADVHAVANLAIGMNNPADL